MLEGLPPQPQVIEMFKGCFSYNNFLSLLSSHRNASAPVLNGIPYKVYKKCSKLSKFLFQMAKWKGNLYSLIKNTFRKFDIGFPRPIALLNVKDKLFFSLISKQLESHLV